MVYAKEPLGGPEAVLDYLGRSGTHRVAISNERSRAWVTPAYLPGNGSVAMTTAEVDLTVPANSNKARCSCLTTTGALTANRNVIVPNSWQGTVFCNNNTGLTFGTISALFGLSYALIDQAQYSARRWTPKP